MDFASSVREHVAACFTGIYVQTREQDEAQAELARLCREQAWTIAHWNCDQGLHANDLTDSNALSPIDALHALPGLASDTTTLLVMRNMHRFIESPDVAQAIDTQLSAGKQARTFVVMLAPIVAIPPELARSIVVIEHDMPSRAELEVIAFAIATEPGEIPEGPELTALLDAAVGLTRLEAESAFSLSLVRHGRIRAEEVWDLKAQTLKKSGLMTLHRGPEKFADLGGLEAVKSFTAQALAPGKSAKARPRGVMLLGVPGTGKSALAKALGNETGRPTLTLDIGALMGGLVGQTEANVREALRIVDAMAPCVLFIDEIEKGLSGVNGSNDSGVSARLFGSLLTWMNDHETDAFMVATSNDITKLPPEFTRAERFDAIYYIDFPTAEERAAIWTLHMSAFGLDSQTRPNDRDWTGAEIKACCRLASMLGTTLVEAARNVVPISATAGEKIEQQRTWADGRTLAADRPGAYRKRAQPAPTTTEASGPQASRKIERPRSPERN